MRLLGGIEGRVLSLCLSRRRPDFASAPALIWCFDSKWKIWTY